MNKEQLIALGLDEETAKKVADASAEELKTFIPKTRFDEINTTKKDLETQLKDRDKQLEDLKKVDADKLRAEIDKLQEDNKTKQKEHEAEIKQIKINNAVELALTNSKAKNTKAVKALLELENAELVGDTVKGLDDQIKKLTESDDSKFLFDNETSTQQPDIKGAKPGEGNPPGTQPSSIGAGFAQQANKQGEPVKNTIWD